MRKYDYPKTLEDIEKYQLQISQIDESILSETDETQINVLQNKKKIIELALNLLEKSSNCNDAILGLTELGNQFENFSSKLEE